MMIIRLLGAFVVISLIMMPAFSQPGIKGCTCVPGDCHGKTCNNCCCRSSNDCISMSCPCTIQMSSFSGQDWYYPSYYYFGKSSSRSNSKQNTISSTGSGSIGAFVIEPKIAPDNVGPPDLDVVEYLPPSAKQVFLALASDGPLTQKDLISKTDLPARTVRYALSRLKGEDLLEERFFFRDGRQSLYSLNGIV